MWLKFILLQRRHAGQHFAFEKFQRRAAAGRGVRHFLVRAEFLRRRGGVAAADHRGRARLPWRPQSRRPWLWWPFANAGNSNTPAGPFQMMVLARSMASANSLTTSGPRPDLASRRECRMASSAALTWRRARICRRRRKSTGRMIFLPFACAFFIRSGTILAPSASKRRIADGHVVRALS